MAKSNTPDEKLKNQTQTLQHTVFADDYNNDELLYPNEKLGILKRNLEIVRSMVDKSDRFKKKCSALRRPMNNAPLHEVYKNINNKDSFSILASILEKENNVNNITSTENQNIKSTENDIKSVRNDNGADIQKFNKPSKNTNQINSREINKNAKKSLNVKQDVIKKIKITSTKNTQSSKKKTNQHNKIVTVDKTK